MMRKQNIGGRPGFRLPFHAPKRNIGWLLWLVSKYLRGRSTVHAGSSLWLAVLGIMIGVLTLISVLTGMSGLQSLLTDSIDEVTAYHLQIIVENETESVLLREHLRENPVIQNVTRFREAPMLLNTEYGEPVVAVIRAVETQDFVRDRGRKAVMHTMGPVLEKDLEEPNHMWIGHTFSYEHGFGPGELIQVISAEHVAGSRNIEAKQNEFLVSATYRLGNPNVEKNYVFIGLSSLTDQLFHGSEYYLGLKLRHKSLANSVKHQVTQQMESMRQAGKISRYRIRTGREANRAFFNALRTEKSFLQLLVSLIFIVVAFQIFQSTRRTVYARIPELMLLRALGAGTAEVRSIFLLESLLVGLLGVGLGTVCGILVSRYMNEILLWISGLLFEGPGLIPHIATDVSSQDLFIVAGSALVFSSAAGWLATRKFLHINLIEVLRNE
ncbi:FtsX-like permease family protein [Candidatus Haliotispira prima]|uniref:FtsX-like permease family protein n=1 Tax=Candidatus Haliotispira prima TaxID=3034016 RepID=A0ABY8MIN5_9SPIO|nr:FtsX-like permease family protein [Candidatus Haliotispira prima]